MNEHGQVYFDGEERIPRADRERFRKALEEDREIAQGQLDKVERAELKRRFEAAVAMEATRRDGTSYA